MSDPLDIAILSPGMPHDGATLAQRSLGGSETAAIMVAKALAARGHHLTVLSPTEGGIWDNVHYIPIQAAPQYLAATPHDVTVVSRAIEAFGQTIASDVRILWVHDLALKRQRAGLASVAWQLDAIYALSRFQLEQVRGIHPLLSAAPGTLVQSRNGIDLPWFEALRALDQPRDPWKLVYGSRPERGLDVALAIMHRCAQRGLPYVLHVSHYDNTVPEMAGLYEALWAKARSMPNVRLLGALKQGDWHRELVTARALLYPGCAGPFREISCLVSMEAQACGTPVVYVRKGALPETVHPTAGIGIGDEATDVTSADYIEAFVDALASLAGPQGDARWEAMHGAGIAHAQQHLGWDGVAAQWEADFQARLQARRGNPWRTARHLARIGEREAV